MATAKTTPKQSNTAKSSTPTVAVTNLDSSFTPITGAILVDSTSDDVAALRDVTDAIREHRELQTAGAVCMVLNYETKIVGEMGWRRFDRKTAEETTTTKKGITYGTEASRSAWSDGGRDGLLQIDPETGESNVQHQATINVVRFEDGAPTRKGRGTLQYELASKRAIVREVDHQLAHWLNASGGGHDPSGFDMSGGGKHNTRFIENIKALGWDVDSTDTSTNPILSPRMNDLSGDAQRYMVDDIIAMLDARLPGWFERITHRLNTPAITSPKPPAKRVTWTCDVTAKDGKHEDGSKIMVGSFAAGLTVKLTCDVCGNKMRRAPKRS